MHCTRRPDRGRRICWCTDVHTKSVWRRARGITNGEYQNSSAYVNICTICNGIRENRGCKRMVSLIMRWRKWWKGLCWVDVLKGCGAIRPWHTMSFLGPISFSRLMKRTHTHPFSNEYNLTDWLGDAGLTDTTQSPSSSTSNPQINIQQA